MCSTVQEQLHDCVPSSLKYLRVWEERAVDSCWGPQNWVHVCLSPYDYDDYWNSNASSFPSAQVLVVGAHDYMHNPVNSVRIYQYMPEQAEYGRFWA